jgi:hypothetical protein
MQPQMQMERPRPAAALGLLAIFYSPVEAYANSGRSGWLIALAAACLIAVLGNTFVVDKIGYGTIVRNQLESNTALAERLGPSGIDKTVSEAESGRVGKFFAYGGALIALPVISFILAGVALGFLLVLGGQTTFWNVLTAGAWATYAVLAVTTAGTVATAAAMTDFSGVDVSRLFGLNAGIFLADAKPVVRALASGIDLLAFWGIFLQVVGVKTISQRVTTGQALTVYMTLHVLYVMMRAGWAAIFG